MPAAAGSDRSSAEPDPIVKDLLVDGRNTGGEAVKQAGDGGAVAKTMPIDAMVIGAYVAVVRAHHPADGDKDVHDELQHQFLVKAVLADADLHNAPLHGIRELCDCAL